MKPASAPVPGPLLALFREQRLAELVQQAQALLQAEPGHAGVWKALGAALAALGRDEEACEAKARAVELAPGDVEARLNLANAHAAAGRHAQAAAQVEQAASLPSHDAALAQRLARMQAGLGQLAGAEASLRRVLALAPSAAAHVELGNLLRNAHRMPEAEAAYRAALALDPASAEAANNLANTLADLRRGSEALAAYDQALRHAPARAEIHSNQGNLLKDLGDLRGAQASYRKAIALDPGFAGAWSNLLLSMNHDPDASPRDALALAREFGRHAQSMAGPPLAPQARAHAGPLRVGVVSGDLRHHPVGHFLEGWVGQLDRGRIALLAFPTVHRDDALTARLRPAFADWRPIAGLGDEAAARAIHAQGPDVLLDLSGHTAHNRLGVFAWRPAPVQASWLGYFATTGLPAMDWLLADAWSVPPAEEDRFTERIWRLPHTRLCFAPPREAPEPAPGPSARGEAFTFGSFQALGKLNDAVLGLWARALHAAPGARLRLQSGPLSDASVRSALQARMAALGIPAERTVLHGEMPRRGYLAAHAEVDLLLDSFPFPGGTTTCEALWMGVPTLTLAGGSLIGRQGSALMRAAGLGDWAALDAGDYLARAVQAASDPRPLHRLRASLRSALPSTPLFDAAAFAADFTQAMQGLARTAVPR